MKPRIGTAIGIVALAIASGGVAAANDAPTVTIYTQQCAMCHGADGKGQSAMGKNFKLKDWGDGKTLNAMTDTDIANLIHVGKGLMPGFTALGAEQLKAMVGYIRTFQK